MHLLEKKLEGNFLEMEYALSRSFPIGLSPERMTVEMRFLFFFLTIVDHANYLINFSLTIDLLLAE